MRNGASDTRRGLQVTTDGVRGLRDLTKGQLDTLLKEAHREYAGRFSRGRSVPMPEGVRVFKSTDLPLVAWWELNGVVVIAVQENRDPMAGRFQQNEYVLADINGNADRLKLEFPRSESAQFDSRMRLLKKMTRG
jgi:hypothetical protein